MAAQLTARKRAVAGVAGRRRSWMARATSSLPVPLSPVISTVERVGADLADQLEDALHGRAVADDLRRRRAARFSSRRSHWFSRDSSRWASSRRILPSTSSSRIGFIR